MISSEGTGKTIEQAIENALLELKVPREDVDIKVLSEGGFLKKAKVLVTISEDAREKYEKKAEKRAEVKAEEPKESPKEEKKEDFSENFMKKKIEKTEKESASAEKKENSSEKVEEKEAEDEKEFSVRKKKEPIAFLREILAAIGAEAEIERTVEGEYVKYSLVGDSLSELIGHHGECMGALEHLMRLSCMEEDHKKILLDVGGYREKRAENLTELAKRVADKVAASGRYHKFEPMNASERKIIHTALQNDDRVTTMSKGVEPQRYLIVFPRNYED